MQFTARWPCLLIIHGMDWNIAAQQMRKVWLVGIDPLISGEPRVEGGFFSAYRIVQVLRCVYMRD